MSKSKSKKTLLSEHLHQFYATVAVAPFVVVPADDLHEFAAVGHGQFAVENAGVRVPHDVDRDERLVAVFENVLVTLARGRFFERVID
jgi:hypothetical protein